MQKRQDESKGNAIADPYAKQAALWTKVRFQTGGTQRGHYKASVVMPWFGKRKMIVAIGSFTQVITGAPKMAGWWRQIISDGY